MSDVIPLQGKRVLFIGIGFYDYDQAIISKLKELGGEVSYLCSTYNSLLYRLAKSIKARKLAKSWTNKIRIKKIKNTSLNNDYIFIIKGENLTQQDIDLLKSRNPKAECILYFWDDLKRIDNRGLLLSNFSNIWSFDPDDCQKYGFKFRPLFYRDNLVTKLDKNIFLSSIGWCHSNRLELFRSISSQLKAANKTFFLKLYIGKKSYLINRYFRSILLSSDRDLLITTPIKYNETMKIISSSICVLDIPHPSQKGLSIRTIEALKCGCHIITSNVQISTYKSINNGYYSIIDTTLPLDISKIIKNNFPLSKLDISFSLGEFIKELFDFH